MSHRVLRKRRSVVTLFISLFLLFFGFILSRDDIAQPEITQEQTEVLSHTNQPLIPALDVLETLAVKGRAAKTGYSRNQFSDGWARVDSCDVRNLILQRDLMQIEVEVDGCSVLAGVLLDPYSNQEIIFVRGAETSDDVQIDHVVSLSDAWQKGAQQLPFDKRFQFSNDPLNLLAVDGNLNKQKSNSDAASWLPPNKAYRCRFVARQIAVKQKYGLWVTAAEKAAMQRVLNSCKDQPLPLITPVSLLPNGAWNSAHFLSPFGFANPLLALPYVNTVRCATPGHTKISQCVETGTNT